MYLSVRPSVHVCVLERGGRGEERSISWEVIVSVTVEKDVCEQGV